MSVRSTSKLLLLSLFVAACGGEAPPAEGEAAAGAPPPAAVPLPAPGIDVAIGLGVTNAALPMPGLVTAGQLSVDQLSAMAAAGFSNFISLRSADEPGAGWEEALAPTVGATFTRVPVAGAAGLNRETVAKVAELLDGAGDESTVLYCASSNRVGALLALKAHWVDGATPEEALQLGRAAGMTRLEETVVKLLEEGEGD